MSLYSEKTKNTRAMLVRRFDRLRRQTGTTDAEIKRMTNWNPSYWKGWTEKGVTPTAKNVDQLQFLVAYMKAQWDNRRPLEEGDNLVEATGPVPIPSSGRSVPVAAPNGIHPASVESLLKELSFDYDLTDHNGKITFEVRIPAQTLRYTLQQVEA